MSPAAIDRKTLADVVLARLADQLPAVKRYKGEAVDVPVLEDALGNPNPDGYVVPYVVLHVAPGLHTSEVDLADTVIDLNWPFQLTCAAAFQDDVEALMSDVDAAIFRWEPIVEGLRCGPCKPPLGGNQIPVQLDRSVTPHRPFVPLQYVTTITKS